MLGLFAIMGGYQELQQQFFSDLPVVIPLNPIVWLIIVFVLFVIFILEGAYRRIKSIRTDSEKREKVLNNEIVTLKQEIQKTKTKPKLKVIESVWAFTSWGLRVKNESDDKVENCIGFLEYVVAAEVNQLFSTQDMWGSHQLMWEDVDTIPGRSSIILRVSRNETKNIDGEIITSYYPAFNKTDSILKPSFPFIDIILVISLQSRDCIPLYNICYFYGVTKTIKGVYSQKQLEIIAANLEQCPTIDECRKILAEHIARNQS